MKLEKPLCPECGEPAVGTLERLKGCAQFEGPIDGARTSLGISTEVLLARFFDIDLKKLEDEKLQMLSECRKFHEKSSV